MLNHQALKAGLAALEQLLGEQGYQFDHGSSIAAATAWYREKS